MGRDALPFIKHYPVDEEADPSVRAMSAAEFGAYRHLCNVAWAQTPPCSIPDDDETLARWSTLGEDEWSRAKRRVLALWDLRTDGRWYHPQLVRLWQEARQIGNVRRENGAKGGRPKKQIESKTKANDNHLVTRVSEIQSIRENNPPLPPLPGDVPEGVTLGGGGLIDSRIMPLCNVLLGDPNHRRCIGQSAALTLARQYPGSDLHYAAWLVDQSRKDEINKPYDYIKQALSRKDKYPGYKSPGTSERRKPVAGRWE